MALSDYGTLITIMAYFGEPDSATLAFIKQNSNESYTAAALTQFRKRNGIHKNSRAECIAIRYGLEIVERFTAGETVKAIAQDLGFKPEHVSAAIKKQGGTTERRCTQQFLLDNYRFDLIGLIVRETPCREAAKWLETYRKITCSKNVVLEAMKSITADTKYLRRLLQSIDWVFSMPAEEKQLAIRELMTALPPLIEP